MKIQMKYAVLAVLFFILLSFLDAVVDSVVFDHWSFHKWLLYDLTSEAAIDRAVVAIAFFLFGVFAAKAREKQKKTEEALRDTEAKFQVMVEKTPLGICFLDGEGILSACNGHFARFAGREKDEIIGTSVRDLMSPIAHRELVDVALGGNVGNYVGWQLFSASDDDRAVKSWFIPSFSAGGVVLGVIGIVEDTTEQMKAEKRLRESEQRLDLAVWGAELGLWDHDLLTQQVTCNDLTVTVLGYTREEINPTLESWRSMIHHDDLQRALEAYRAHIDGRTPFYESEHRVRTKSGEWIWILARGKVVDRDAEGGATRFVGIGLDITQRKDMENNLKVSEEKFRTLFEQLQQPVAILALDGHFVEANQAFLQLVGYTREELARKRFEDLCANSTGAFPWQYETDQSGYARNLEWNALTKGGEIRNCILNATVTHSHEGTLQYQIACHDATDLKRTEASLLETVARLNALLDATPDIVYFKDARGCFMIANTAFEELVGLRREAILGSHAVPAWDEKLPKQRSELESVLLREKKPVRFEEVINEGQPGCTILETVKFPVLDNRGNVIGLGAVARDITARKTVQSKLEESLAEKEVLLGEIHHRVKNNLQVMSSLLDMQAARIEDEVAKAILKDAENRIWSMALAYEKLFRSKNLAGIRVDEYLENLVLDLVCSHEQAVNLANPVVDVVEDLLEIDTLIPLGLIVNELVSNALRHTFPAGGRGLIEVSLRSSENKMYALNVFDNGLVRVDDGSQGGYDQSLGLHLVELLLKQLQGEMSLDSGDGTTSYRIVFRSMKRRRSNRTG